MQTCLSVLLTVADIFLLTRIREYRQMGVCDPGVEDSNNVLLGLTMTGRVITAAGQFAVSS